MDVHQNTAHRRERRRTSRTELIERWAALVAAVVSLIVAFYALRIAQRTDANVALTVKSVSTRYIGQFPDILPEIVDALRVAHSNISILTDVPGYAIFSAHNTYLDYEAILHKKAQTLPIRIAVLPPQLQKRMLGLQFGARSWADISNEENYRIFIRSMGLDGKITDLEGFIDALAHAHKQKEIEFSQDMQVREYTGDMPVYLWLIDDRIAVLSIPNLARNNPEETAFRTEDSRLIKQLSYVFESYWSSAQPIHQPN